MTPLILVTFYIGMQVRTQKKISGVRKKNYNNQYLLMNDDINKLQDY